MLSFQFVKDSPYTVSILLLHCRTCRAPDCLWIMKLLFGDGGRKTILHDALSKLVGAKCSTKTSITTPFHEITLNIIIVAAHFAVFCCGCISHACKKWLQCCLLKVYYWIMNRSVTFWIDKIRWFFVHNMEYVLKKILLAFCFTCKTTCVVSFLTSSEVSCQRILGGKFGMRLHCLLHCAVC